MSKIVDGVRVLTFAEWEKLPAVQELLDTLEECEECNGTGDHNCDCGCDSTHECGYCDGTGYIGQDLSAIYHSELKSELEKLLRWCEGLGIRAGGKISFPALRPVETKE